MPYIQYTLYSMQNINGCANLLQKLQKEIEMTLLVHNCRSVFSVHMVAQIDRSLLTYLIFGGLEKESIFFFKLYHIKSYDFSHRLLQMLRLFRFRCKWQM